MGWIGANGLSFTENLGINNEFKGKCYNYRSSKGEGLKRLGSSFCALLSY
ncbi:hypothetical protein YSY43_31400 [Paenibacillus sp. YSY-4.3]